MNDRESKKIETSELTDDQRNSIREEVRVTVEKILQTMSDNGHEIGVTFVIGERTTQYLVSCKKNHIAKIMGAQGKNINALRTVIAAMLGNHGIRSIIEIPYFSRD